MPGSSKVLIYRLGSIGDTVVALPSLHLVARAFPTAERRVLTNLPASNSVASIDSVLGGSGLVHGYLSYPLRLRNPAGLWRLIREVRRWGPDALIYLAEPRGLMKAVRDLVFFKACGIPKVIGVPLSEGLRKNQPKGQAGHREHEAERLARCLGELGDARLDDPASWDLHLSSEEEEKARRVLYEWPARGQFIACSLGSRVPVKDWGAENWARLLKLLSGNNSLLGLVLIGAREHFALSEKCSGAWRGPRLNLCGKLSPRESAAVMKRSLLFLGQDGGPMHLAAAVGVPCVAIFSGHSHPGVWFPWGEGHVVIRHETKCSGCGLEVCTKRGKQCLASVSVEEVSSCLRRVLFERLRFRPPALARAGAG